MEPEVTTTARDQKRIGHDRGRAPQPIGRSGPFRDLVRGRDPRPDPPFAPHGENIERAAPQALQGRAKAVIIRRMPVSSSIRVPATVAGLGPGLDALGAAVRMHLKIDAEPRSDGVHLAIQGEGAGSLPEDGSNLVVRAMNAFFDKVTRRPPGFSLRIDNAIPIGFGLGSSAAAVVGGLMAARSLSGRRTSQTELIELGAELESRTANLLPAILGGLVVGYRDGRSDLPRHFRLRASERLIPILAVPPGGLAPETPGDEAPHEQVASGDAQFTASRAALLVAALSAGAGAEVLAEAMHDRLREPGRLAQMPETAAVHTEIRSAGLPVALGGRGPSLVVVVPRPEAPLRAEQIRRICRDRGTGWRVFVTEWEPEGAATA